jgi:hypothetical protein
MELKSFMSILQKCCKYCQEELDPVLVYTESNYQNTLVHYLIKSMPEANVQKEIQVIYRLSDGFIFGNGRMDIVVETKNTCFILELKSNVDAARKYNSRFSGQTNRYVQHFETQKKKYGILVIFSNCSPIIKSLP